MLTAFGNLSRNRTTGTRIAKSVSGHTLLFPTSKVTIAFLMFFCRGEKIEDITATTTVEGKQCFHSQLIFLSFFGFFIHFSVVSLNWTGVPTAQVAVYFADKCGLELPIFRAVAGVLNGSLKIEVGRFFKV